ncbi:uncharacterized protein F4812DRAFT_463448 [Daldinia caldariorum]|uniref:uncharacterized protein n=1 Tax=Daldinia caldariorum TaxID=326644 RepID=UPI002007D52D|nr:uncharacterized protein F4812DRAFT_463448 [Daldinia caldariorum]KAI1463620.1 hypothetical protein F4812DRAFT_463448 [Daldinia caldariorum]
MIGYAAIAKSMSDSSDLTSFRNFLALNYQNLLYLQAELTHLEELWRRTEWDIQGSPDNDKREKAPHDWAKLQKDEEAWAQFTQLRGKLKEYNEALIQQHMISHFDKPSKQSLKALNHILDDNSKAAVLIGKDHKTWSDKETLKDLVTVGPVERLDMISRFLVRLYLALKYKVLGRFFHESRGVVRFESSQLLLPTKVPSVVLSSLLPIAAISVLCLVQSTWRRLLILAGFTSTFSLVLSLISAESKRSELFSVTAAFTAVLVVFIGTNTEKVETASS